LNKTPPGQHATLIEFAFGKLVSRKKNGATTDPSAGTTAVIDSRLTFGGVVLEIVTVAPMKPA
jgi:hypothetical protein